MPTGAWQCNQWLAPQLLEDPDIHAELVGRAASLSKRLTLLSVGASLILACGLVFVILQNAIETGVRSGKMLGILGGVTFCAVFLTGLLGLLWLSRRYVVSSVREWIAVAVRRHGANADELEYIIGMYEKSSPLSRRGGEEDLD